MNRANFGASFGSKSLARPKPASGLNLVALFAEGLSHHQAWRLNDAEVIYSRILALQPAHFDSRHLLGVVELQRGQHREALRHFDLALKIDRRNPVALNNRSIALQKLNRLDEALATLDRAIASRPAYAEAHSNRANVLKALKRFDEALVCYDRALSLRPDYAEAYSNRADVLNTLRRFEEALASADRALLLQPDFPEAHCNRASALYRLSRLSEALESCDRAIALRQDYAEAHLNRGGTLHELDRPDEALASHDRVLALRPDIAEAHSNRGNTLQELKRFEESLASYDRAILLRRDFAEAHSNKGNALKELARFDEALTEFDRATALKPSFADAHYNAALCRMLLGDFEHGLLQYERRWAIDQLKGEARGFRQPQWDGSQEIAGRSVLLHAEQGFGDTLQFCRYAPFVAARGARVILEVQRPLLTLMRSVQAPMQVIARGDPLPDFDLHCPLLSLPFAFATRLDTIPGATPYLFADEAASRAWRDRLGVRQGPRIGLVWAGDPRKRLPNAHRIDRQRSVDFDRLEPILKMTGCMFYSLQKGDDAVAQLRHSALSCRVVDWTDELRDFADTAALIDNLDLVIAVDTAVAHLAAALGKPLWLLNRYNTCWRWLLDRSDSPWYPTARLFRQDKTRMWDKVMASVAEALGESLQTAREF